MEYKPTVIAKDSEIEECIDCHNQFERFDINFVHFRCSKCQSAFRDSDFGKQATEHAMRVRKIFK